MLDYVSICWQLIQGAVEPDFHRQMWRNSWYSNEFTRWVILESLIKNKVRFPFHTQPVDSVIFSSRGSPRGWSSKSVTVWQQARPESMCPWGRSLGSGTISEKPSGPPSITPHTSRPSSVRVPVWKNKGPLIIEELNFYFSLLNKTNFHQANRILHMHLIYKWTILWIVSQKPRRYKQCKHTAGCTIIFFPSYLVKAEDWELATDIDARWTDAEDALVLEPSLCIDGASSDGCRQCWRHYNGHNIQSPNDHLLQAGLDIHQDRSEPARSFHRCLHILHHVDAKPTSSATMLINRNDKPEVIICFRLLNI